MVIGERCYAKSVDVLDRNPHDALRCQALRHISIGRFRKLQFPHGALDSDLPGAGCRKVDRVLTVADELLCACVEAFFFGEPPQPALRIDQYVHSKSFWTSGGSGA